MDSPGSYIPAREADFVVWITNFNSLILAAPTTYGLTTGDATALNTMTTTYLTLYSASQSNTTRTPSVIANKDVARTNVTAAARTYAQIIQGNPAITNDQKSALGITIRKTLPTPIPAPTTSPLLSFIAATPLQHTLRASDQLTPDKRGKPFGSLQLTLRVWYTAQGASPTGNPDQTLLMTKQPMAIDFPDGSQGKLAHYVGNWNTRTGLVGPNSADLARTIV